MYQKKKIVLDYVANLFWDLKTKKTTQDHRLINIWFS